MDNYLNEKNPELNNNYFCPYCNSQKTKPIINLSNVVYDQNFVALINSLSSHIKIFYQKIKKIIDDIRNINSSLGSQTSHSKFLVKGIMIKNNNFVERYRQLCDRIDMISESKKILDDNFSLINNNLSIFITDVKQVFKKMKSIRIQRINEAFNKTKKIEDMKLNGNFINNNIFSENNILNINNNDNYANNNYFNDININDEDNFVRKVLSSTQSPKNKLNISSEKIYNNKIKYLLRKIKTNDLERKNSNTLIFPNNINQNIFNCTITSRDFNNINRGRNNDYFDRINNNKALNNTNMKKNGKTKNYSRNSLLMDNKNCNKRYIDRSSSIPDILYKNKNFSSLSITNQQKVNNKVKTNSLPKNNTNGINKYLINKNNNNTNNLLKLCYKVRIFLNIFNNNKNNFDTNNIINEKIDELNNIINNFIIQNNNKNKNNYNKQLHNSAKNIIKGNNDKDKNGGILINNMVDNNNNLDLIKNIKLLNEKIKELENKLKEKNEYIAKYIQKYDNNPINQNNEILLEKNNEITELNKNNILLQKENKELKAKIIQLKNINKEAEKLSQIIINKDLEIEQLKLKKNELKNISFDSKR